MARTLYPEEVRYLPHLSLLLLLSLVSALTSAQDPSAFALATDVSEAAMVNASGQPRFIRQVVTRKVMLFVVLSGSSSTQVCRVAGLLTNLAAQEPLPLAILHSATDGSPAKCSLVQPAPQSVQLFHRPALTPQTAAPNAFAALVDDSFHVRWRGAFSPDDSGLAALRISVNAWLQARQSFEANCGHCHGMDGAQASSPDVKSLVGITRKYSEPEVLRLGAQFGGVDMTGWTDAKRETLLLYLRGL
jgi:cytochrome c553